MQEAAKRFINTMRNSIGAIEPKTPVVVNFYGSGIITNAQVAAIIINDSTVFYDVSVKVDKPEWDSPLFAKIQRIHSAYVWEIEEYEEYCSSIKEERRPATSELQAILHSMDYYNLTSGFIITATKGGQPKFYEEVPSFEIFSKIPVTRQDVLKMINES